jgi:hypothetical protein
MKSKKTDPNPTADAALIAAQVAAYESGQSLRAIAEIHGTNYESVRTNLREVGVTLRPRGPVSTATGTIRRTMYISEEVRERLREVDPVLTQSFLACARDALDAGLEPITGDPPPGRNVGATVPAGMWRQAAKIGERMSPRAQPASVLVGLVARQLGLDAL